jgi:hypothetical protein
MPRNKQPSARRHGWRSTSGPAGASGRGRTRRRHSTGAACQVPRAPPIDWQRCWTATGPNSARCRGAPLGARVPEASVNVAYLAREIECLPGLNSTRAKNLIQAAPNDCGLAADTFLRIPVTGLLDGSPWKDQLSYFGIEQDVRLLRAAAYIVIAYLSGMRDAEKAAELHRIQHCTVLIQG